MSGHSKWSKIKRKKGASDAKRSKIFSRIIKEITVAVKEGGSNDADFNPRLRVAIANAKGVNMPKENIDRAIKKADTDTASYSEVNYEGYAPGGIAVFVECTTDNLNRTVANIRSYFNKRSGSLGTNGSVDYMFERKGIFIFPQGEWNEDDLTLELIDAGAEDVDMEAGEVTVSTDVNDYGNMQKKLDDLGIEPSSVNLERIPTTPTKVDIETARKALALVELLEEDDDVNAVFHNMELTEEIEAALE